MEREPQRNINIVVGEIIRILSEKEKSIAEISRLININRSTLVYYLNKMEAEQIIEKKFIKEGVRGSPTIIKLSSPFLQKHKENIDLTQKKEIAFLELIKKEGSIKSNKINKEDLINIYPKLRFRGYIENRFFLTEKGLKFLEDNK